MISGTTQQGNHANTTLSFQGIGKAFHTDSGIPVQALQGVDLDIEEARITTILGPSGAGKTTLLNLAAGVEQADEGSLRYPKDYHPKTDLAYVFQHYTLLPWRTLHNNVAFGLQLQGIARQERHAVAQEWIARVGLSEFSKAHPHELSGGMRQRAAIAQALAIGPKLLLMDEPFGSLDDATRRDLQSMLIDLQRQCPTTILFVTHNIDEAITLGDHIVVLSPSPGTIRAQMPVNLERPRDKTNAAYYDLYIKIRHLMT